MGRIQIGHFANCLAEQGLMLLQVPLEALMPSEQIQPTQQTSKPQNGILLPTLLQA